MSHKELGQSNGKETKGSMLEIVRSWAKNPKIAEGRALKGVLTYSLRCRFESASQFNAALTIAEDRQSAHLKNSIEQVEVTIPLEHLLSLTASQNVEWIDVDTGEGKVSIRLKSLKFALQAFGLIL